MEALYIESCEADGAMLKEDQVQESGDKEEGGVEASSHMGFVTDEESDEDSESPPVIRRKVSFADAFGLNLVSVKEFDDAAVTGEDVSLYLEEQSTCSKEELCLSCLFTVPSSPEELDQRLQAQMVELESIELLPGTTTVRGIIRVVNLCYTKSVYVRMSLDCWTSNFDLLAEYLPGSSDRKTDRFTFKYTLVPPLEREETRMDFCLCYDTPVGTFWANNQEMNYVVFCHKKLPVSEPLLQEESDSCRSKRSCLRASRKASAGETNKQSRVFAETEATHKAEETNKAETQSLLCHKESTLLVESIKSRRREKSLSRVQEYISQQKYHLPEAYSHDLLANSQEVNKPLPSLWDDSASFLNKHQRKQSKESSRVLTYHEIPLLTLDWNNDKAQQSGDAHFDDLCSERTTESEASVDNTENTPSVNDVLEAFPNGTDDTTDIETSVCDVWQAFLNDSSSTVSSSVLESEWLQTATSVSPSNHKEALTKCPRCSQKHKFQMCTDTPTTVHAHSAGSCQPLLAGVALNTVDHHPAEACVRGPGDDNTVTQDASQRSETNPRTDTRQGFSREDETPGFKGSVDSSVECHKQTRWEPKREGIIEGADRKGRDETSTPPTADLVTSSGDSKTTEMTAMPESENANVVDRISLGVKQEEGLSSSREGQGTGTTHNTMDDTLAFNGTIRQRTKDEKRLVFSTFRQGVEEGIVNISTENKVSTGEEIFRLEKTEKYENSQRYADEKQCEEFRLSQNTENPLRENEGVENEIRPAQPHADEFSSSHTGYDSFTSSQKTECEFKSEESENENVASNNSELFKETEGESSYCTTIEENERIIGAKARITQVLNVKEWQNNDKALDTNSSWQRGNTSIISGIHSMSPKPVQPGEELHIQKEEENDLKITQMQENIGLKSEADKYGLVLNQTQEGQTLSCDGINEEQQEIPRHTKESKEMQKVFQGDHNTFRPSLEDECHPTPTEVIELRWTHSWDDMKGQTRNMDFKINPKDDPKEINTLRALQCQPEILRTIKEDMSQKGNDRVSIGKLKIEELGELMGNVQIPQEERKSTPAQLKKQELSADIESSPYVEYKELLEGTKDPITAENAVALELIESGLEKKFIERFGEDLVQAIWEEVFDMKAQASKRDLHVDDGMVGNLADTSNVTEDCHLPFEKDANDTFDSGVFSLTELPSDLIHGQGLEHAFVSGNNEYSPTEQRYLPSELQTNSNSRACLYQDPAPISASKRQLSTVSAQSSTSDQESDTQIKEKSITRQGTYRQIEEGKVTHKESVHRSHQPSRACSEKLKESHSLTWWDVFYILCHITRLLICAVFVAGFFFIVYLCDFPAFFALYVFSLCWWFGKWKRQQVVTTKKMVGQAMCRDRRNNVIDTMGTSQPNAPLKFRLLRPFSR